MTDTEEKESIDQLNLWLRQLDDSTRTCIPIAARLLAEIPGLTADQVAECVDGGGELAPLADNAIIATEACVELARLLHAIADGLQRRRKRNAPAPVRTPPHLN